MNVASGWRRSPEHPLGQGRSVDPSPMSTAQRLKDRLDLVLHTLLGIPNHMMVKEFESSLAYRIYYGGVLQLPQHPL